MSVTDHLGTGADARDQRLHLLGGQVLCLVDDDVAIEKRAAAHEVQRADLDALGENVVGRLSLPVAAGTVLLQHFEVVHPCAHPRSSEARRGGKECVSTFKSRW